MAPHILIGPNTRKFLAFHVTYLEY